MQAKHARDLVEAAVPAERGDAPEEFLCPVSCDVMDDPVVAADNRTYEHKAIQRWIDQKTKELAEVQDLMCHADASARAMYEQKLVIGVKSPLTGDSLSHLDLVPNDRLREEIQAFRGRREAALGGGGGPFVGTVEGALESIGLGRYASVLLEEKIGDLEVLGLLTGRDLEEMGIPAKDHDALMGLAQEHAGNTDM